MLRGLEQIAKISVVCLGVIALTLVAALQSAISDLPQRKGSVHLWDGGGGRSGVGCWFGLTTFAFGCFGVAQYVFQDMNLGRDARPFYRALTVSFSGTTLLYICVGALGYMCYGSATKEVLYFSHQGASPIFLLGCQVGTCAVLAMSFPLTMHPVFTWAEQYVPGFPHVLRIFVTGLLVLLAWWVPSFAVLVGLLGALPAFLLCFVLPAVCHLKMLGRRGSRLQLIVNVCLIAFGVLGMILSMSHAALDPWDHDMRHLLQRAANQFDRLGQRIHKDISVSPEESPLHGHPDTAGDPMRVPYLITFAVVSVATTCIVLLGYRTKCSSNTAAAQNLVQVSQPLRTDEPKCMWTFLVVWYVCVAGDWLQGPYVYALYEAYGFAMSDIAKLFVAGFWASMVFGVAMGTFADRVGRRRACQVYCILHALSCILKHFRSFEMLLLGRLFGGTATSLLCSAFDAWLVSEHKRRGLPEETLRRSFAYMWLGNSVVAIIAGIVGDLTVSLQPLTPVQWPPLPGLYQGGFLLAFDMGAVCLVIGCGLMSVLWEENFASDNSSSKDSMRMLWDAVQVVWSTQELWVLMLLVACFEASMYSFIFTWTPALTTAFSSPPHGLIFATLMMACLAGSSFFDLTSTCDGLAGEAMLWRALAVGAAALVCAGLTLLLWPVGLGHTLMILGAFIVFEFAVGFYFPMAALIKSQVVPEVLRTTIYNMYRIPMNALVLLVLLNDLTLPTIFMACGALLVTVSAFQGQPGKQVKLTPRA
mmetsp:Transcript_89676/g.178301  ORF Transcript_89676/g.178301 Transcript_89676/m.178301 type:complete len:758 (+) Transcript_89676:535-2808(+)